MIKFVNTKSKKNFLGTRITQICWDYHGYFFYTDAGMGEAYQFTGYGIVTIQLSNLNNSVLDNIALRTVLALQPLFIKFPLVANKTTKRALMPLFFVKLFLTKIYHSPKYKVIRARLWTLSATKGNMINKGCNDKVCQCDVI
jgi:hypothetical protein